MAQSRQPHRLVHAANSLCDVMVQGNRELSNGRSREAIDHYSDILYNLSPGHVCAFLNRCMAYVDCGYYELAVMDAYLAYKAARELRKNDTETFNNRRARVAKYIRAEQLHVDAKDSWTIPTPGAGNIDWANSPLASVVINATPGRAIPPFRTDSQSWITELEIRAVYRLCGALFMVGGGARRDVIALIDEARVRLRMQTWENDWFDKLGNEIMNRLTDEVDPLDQEQIGLLGSDTPHKRNERMTKLKENMKARTADVDYGDYDWNTYEPEPKESKWQEEIQGWVSSYSRNCLALVIRQEHMDDMSTEGPNLCVELRANRDFESGELLLSEKSSFNVTTSIPERIEAKRRAGNLDHFYCNNCASLLVVPLKCPNHFQTPRSSIQSQQSSQPTIAVEFDGATHSGLPPSHHLASSSSSASRDFAFCNPNHIAPICSASCRGLSHDYEKGLCGTRMECAIRLGHFNNSEPTSMSDRNIHCLRDLLLLRHIISARNVSEYPLNLPNMKFALSGRSDEENRTLCPWSFISHVVRPIRYLHAFFNGSNSDQFMELGQLDGWVLFTLQAKIEKAMRVTKGPRYMKVFNEEGMLEFAFGPRDEIWNAMSAADTSIEQAINETWTATMNPLINLIRVADPSKGEVPNVVLVRREGVDVYAGQRAIRAGETLLREGDGVGMRGDESVNVRGGEGMEVEGGKEGEVMDEGDPNEIKWDEWVDDKDDGDGEEKTSADPNEIKWDEWVADDDDD